MKKRYFVLMAAVLSGALVVVSGCGGESSSDPVTTNNGSANNTPYNDHCDDGCATEQTQIVDSAARCGYRCVSSNDGANNGTTPGCDQTCPEGTMRERSPQSECGFRCVAVEQEDGSSFNDVDPEFQPDTSMDADPDAVTTRFMVHVENTSGHTGLGTPLAPGAWAVHGTDVALFEAGGRASAGLTRLAEDGDPSVLGQELSELSGVEASGTFATPDGADAAGPALPGSGYTFEVEAAGAGSPHLSFATMFVQSNDLFLATPQAGLPLFDEAGAPLATRVFEGSTDALGLWDAGTEANERPGLGPNQAPRQVEANSGRGESVVGRQVDTTRAIPVAGQLVEVTVTGPVAGAYKVVVVNHSGGAFATPIAPVFYATHNSTFRLFGLGEAASAGLEALGEDGSPGTLVDEHMGGANVDMVGASAVTVERPSDPAGPAAPGERFEFMVTPAAGTPWLSIAAMVVQSNDVFVAFGPEGIRLMDEAGELRDAEAINADIRAGLAIWDAGTEANEVPGAGEHQPPRQAMANSGAADGTVVVRPYGDSANDVAMIGGIATVSVTPIGNSGGFEVTLTNASTATYPVKLTPAAWAIHGDSARLFTDGSGASAALERLAEDGEAGMLATMLEGDADVLASGVESTPMGGNSAGPLSAGDRYVFTVTPDASHRFLSLASMVVPSNDTFVAFGGEGVALLDAQGSGRSAQAIADDIAASFGAWDAGTEQNQAGAGGEDQAPVQAAADRGADEGQGLIRPASDGWWYAPAGEIIRVTISPVE